MLPFVPPSWSARFGLACVLGLCCLPLFVGLRGWDLRNDEALYSYSVDRILETGDWLTPRIIPSDDPFLEKPPLKFWLVAGAIKLGLLPFDECGMRGVDVFFCAVAFLYVYAMGRRLAGPFAGVVGVFLLFSFDPLILEHGIRGNNMEATLVLSYCGGVYHFARWADGGARPRRHALAVAGYFVLGFMTKFVAALFLPIVCGVALALKPGARAAVRAAWRDWTGPLAFAAVAILPWFIYQHEHSGTEWWRVMFREHVVERFAGTLAPAHVRPWHHYFTATWFELGYYGMRTVFAAGLLVLAWRAWRRREWFAQLMFIWWIVPFVLASLGSAKLFYYTYPFLPPLAIGAGAACALAYQVAVVRGRALAVRLGITSLAAERESARRARRVSAVLVLAGALAFALAVWTFVAGSVTIELGGVRLLRNASVARAAVIGVIFWHLAGYGSVLLKVAGAAALALVLPISDYPRRLERLTSIDHPLQTARDCALAVQAADASVAHGVFNRSGDLHHAYFYYLRRLGPWLTADVARPDELRRRFEGAGEQTPVTLSIQEYRRLGGELPSTPYGEMRVKPPFPVATPASAGLTRGLPPGIVIGDEIAIMFPGPYAVCTERVVKAGARELQARPALLAGR